MLLVAHLYYRKDIIRTSHGKNNEVDFLPHPVPRGEDRYKAPKSIKGVVLIALNFLLGVKLQNSKKYDNMCFTCIIFLFSLIIF